MQVCAANEAGQSPWSKLEASEMGQALHMSNGRRSCTCQIYIAGSRQTTVSDSVPRSLAFACLSDVGSRRQLLHLSRINALRFQREEPPIVSMFARFHPWWSQVQVPSSPTSVSSSNEVRQFSPSTLNYC